MKYYVKGHDKFLSDWKHVNEGAKHHNIVECETLEEAGRIKSGMQKDGHKNVTISENINIPKAPNTYTIKKASVCTLWLRG